MHAEDTQTIVKNLLFPTMFYTQTHTTIFMPLFLLLQNQHDDLKKQYYELQEQHQIQGEDHSRALEEHKERYEKLQQTKDLEMSKLKGTGRYKQVLGTNQLFSIKGSQTCDLIQGLCLPLLALCGNAPNLQVVL